MRGLLVALPLLLLAGCAGLSLPERTPPAQDIPVSFRSDSIDGHQIRRVVVIPFQDLSGADSVTAVERAFAAEFQRRQAVEVIPLPVDALTEPEEEAFYRSGTVRTETIVRMGTQYKADAVVYGVVTRYRPYPPMSLGLRLTMVSGGAGDVVWETHGVFDAGDERCAMDVHNWHNNALAPSDNLEGWRRLLTSPTSFAHYACARLVETY